MDAELLQRVMDLAEKTGDRVIIVNPKTGSAHAVLPFDAYEKMAQGKASLRELAEGYEDAEDNDDDIFADDATEGIEAPFFHEENNESAKDDRGSRDAISNSLVARMEEIEKMASKAPPADKMPELSQKEAGGMSSLDVLDDDADEEQYYLEPLE